MKAITNVLGDMQVSEVAKEIDQINWSNYHTAYGNAEAVPTLLKILASSDLENAMDASHELWGSLCHQHAYISSASLPSYPILFKILCSTEDKRTVEILDIMWGFAKCSAEGFFGSSHKLQWVADLRNLIKNDHNYFEKLAKSNNDDIRNFAECILEELKYPA